MQYSQDMLNATSQRDRDDHRIEERLEFGKTTSLQLPRTDAHQNFLPQQCATSEVAAWPTPFAPARLPSPPRPLVAEK